MTNLRKFPQGRELERLKKANDGKRVVPRAKPALMQAARWLEAAGYHEAAAALTQAARGTLKAFWTRTRLEAITRVLAEVNPDGKEPFESANVLTALADFLQQCAARMIVESSRVTKPQSLAIRKIVAVLAVAVLDITDPEWQRHDS